MEIDNHSEGKTYPQKFPGEPAQRKEICCCIAHGKYLHQYNGIWQEKVR